MNVFSPSFFSNSYKITHKLIWWLLIVFILNILLKLIYIDYSPFWYDEIISIQSAYQDFGHIKHTSEWDNNPPFYYYCLSVWIKLFNDSEFNARLLSAIFSSLSAVVLFNIANKYLNAISAIIVSILFLSNNVLFYYSHEARAYSLVLLLALISSLLYFNLKKNQTIVTLIGLGLINFMLIYTHYIAGLVLFFQTLLMLFCFSYKQKKYFSLSILITIAFTLIRFTKKQYLLIFNFNAPNHTFWLEKSTFAYLEEVLSTFLFTKILAIFFLIIILALISISIVKNDKHKFYIIYFFCLGIGAISILYLLGKITPIFLDRYLIFSIPFLFLSISVITFYSKYIYIILTASLIILVWSLLTINYKTDKGMDYKSVSSFIKSEQTKNDLVIVKTKDLMPLFGYYYEKDYLKNKKTSLDSNKNIISCSSWADVNKDVNGYKRIFIIDSYQDYNTKENEFVLNLSKMKTKYFTTTNFKGIKISVYY